MEDSDLGGDDSDGDGDEGHSDRDSKNVCSIQQRSVRDEYVCAKHFRA